MWRRVLRPRVLVYAAVLGLIGAGFIASLALRAPFRADVVRDRGALARLGGGAHPMRFRITLQRGGGSGGAVLVEKSTFVVPR